MGMSDGRYDDVPEVSFEWDCIYILLDQPRDQITLGWAEARRLHERIGELLKEYGHTDRVLRGEEDRPVTDRHPCCQIAAVHGFPCPGEPELTAIREENDRFRTALSQVEAYTSSDLIMRTVCRALGHDVPQWARERRHG